MDLSAYALEVLRDDGELVLYRGRSQIVEPASVLLLAPAAASPAPAILRRLDHEYSLASELDPESTMWPLALVDRGGRTFLVLEDAGEPHDPVLGERLELTTFLRLAVGITVALGRLPRSGIVHTELIPANLCHF